MMLNISNFTQNWSDSIHPEQGNYEHSLYLRKEQGFSSAYPYNHTASVSLYA